MLLLHMQEIVFVDFSGGPFVLSRGGGGRHTGTRLTSVIRPITVVSSANLTMTLELCVAVQSCVYREYGSGLRMQPCGAPVLRISGDEVSLPILTT